jgi:hypothetical protein
MYIYIVILIFFFEEEEMGGRKVKSFWYKKVD